VLASEAVSAVATTTERGLLVLADGAQAAFAAGAVAELARAGVTWRRGAGAGLGAHVALLAVLGEAAEGERRWRRQAELGCPLLRSRLAAARERLGEAPGITASVDAWSVAGWLDDASLAEHLAPELAGVPERLARAGAGLAVAVEELAGGRTRWIDLTAMSAGEAGALLGAAAAFPGGWGPREVPGGRFTGPVWGGVGVGVGNAIWVGDALAWDVVCGFPVPVVARPALGGSLLELIQRRTEGRAADGVSSLLEARGGRSLRLVVPTEAVWRASAGRAGAELGVEYPLPWERNGELTAAALACGVAAAKIVSIEDS
jgi:hypothetical protein